MLTTDTIPSVPAQRDGGLQSADRAADTPVMDIDFGPDPGFFRAYCGEHVPEEHETAHYRECDECAGELARFGEVA